MSFGWSVSALCKCSGVVVFGWLPAIHVVRNSFKGWQFHWSKVKYLVFFLYVVTPRLFCLIFSYATKGFSTFIPIVKTLKMLKDLLLWVIWKEPLNKMTNCLEFAKSRQFQTWGIFTRRRMTQDLLIIGQRHCSSFWWYNRSLSRSGHHPGLTGSSPGSDRRACCTVQQLAWKASGHHDCPFAFLMARKSSFLSFIVIWFYGVS